MGTTTAHSLASTVHQQTLNQKTLAATVTRSGVGLHSGDRFEISLEPAAIDQGITFVCESADGTTVTLPARVDQVHQTLLSTELAQGLCRIRTVEHLLAAVVGMGVTNVQMRLSRADPASGIVTTPNDALSVLEVPLLDGSAQNWVTAIAEVGLIDQGIAQPQIVLREPISVQAEDAFVVGFPAAETRLSYGIHFPVAAIAEQWHSFVYTPETFRTTIAPARTFGFRQQIEQAQAAGLLKGGTLDNALACDETGWLNPPLRFDNEPVRHKLLDLMGDLGLLGALPVGHILAYKASHHLHVEFCRKLLCTAAN